MLRPKLLAVKAFSANTDAQIYLGFKKALTELNLELLNLAEISNPTFRRFGTLILQDGEKVWFPFPITHIVLTKISRSPRSRGRNVIYVIQAHKIRRKGRRASKATSKTK